MPSKTSLIATLADLQTRRKEVHFCYLNSPWAMGPSYRDRLEQLDRQIQDTKDALNHA